MSQPTPSDTDANVQAVVDSLKRQVGEKAAELAIAEGRIATLTGLLADVRASQAPK